MFGVWVRIQIHEFLQAALGNIGQVLGSSLRIVEGGYWLRAIIGLHGVNELRF